MAVGLSEAEANAIITGLDDLWVQLHTADPGAAGTTAIATTTARKQLSLATPVANGSAVSDAALTWTTGEVLATEPLTHYSLWTLAVAGEFEFSGVATGSLASGVEFVIAIGDLTVSVTTVAA